MDMGKIAVLGAGNMGHYIASNLADGHDVTVMDYYQSNLDRITKSNIRKVKADLSDSKTVGKEVADFDIVVSALLESFGYSALEAVIKSGKNAVDISFWEQDKARLLKIEALAKKNNVTAFIDCGIAPGLSNGLVAFFDSLLEGKTRNASIYVGGIPKERGRGFFAPWSIAGLIEEYQRQALCVRNGNPERVQALSIIEKISFPHAGELEAAITDGLRTLPANLRRIGNMAEFTLRYPGHFHQMKLLGNLGYFSNDAVNAGKNRITAYGLSQMLLKKITEGKAEYEEVLAKLGLYGKTYYNCTDKRISPRKVAADVLSRTWKMAIDDRDILVMRVQADDGKTRYAADVYAEHDGVSSAMALTTGGMAALATRVILTGKFGAKGVFPLEKVIKEKPGLLQYFIEGLQKERVSYSQYKLELGSD